MNKKVTIIIPVYNACKTIDYCLKSILNQTCQDFEVLLINDGSSDDSLKKLEYYGKKYPDIFRVLTQNNKGVVETRHRGIYEAKCEYIMFIDNDDFIDEDYVEVLLGEIENSDLDLVISGYRRANFDRVFFTDYSFDDEWTKYKINAPWARIFRRQFLIDNNIHFLKSNIGEDIYFNMLAYQSTNKIRSINYVGYNWFYNNDSVSNTKQRGLSRESDVVFLLNELDEIIINKNDDLINYFFVRYVIWYLLFSGRNASSSRFVEEYEILFKWLNDKGYKNKIKIFSKKIKSEKFKNRFFISVFLFLHKIRLIKLFSKLYCKG